MSNEPSSFFLSKVPQDFTLQPLVFYAKNIVEDLWPVLRSGRLLDKVMALELRSLLENFVQAFKYCYASIQYTMFALNNLRQLLGSWDDATSSRKRWVIERILKDYALAFASAVDSSRAHTGVREGMEVLLPKVIDAYGSNTVLERVFKQPLTRQTHVVKDTIQSIGDATLVHIQQSERKCFDFVNLLREVNNMLTLFVQDERISLTQPLTSIPVWAANPVEVWETLWQDTLRTEIKLTRIAYEYKELFHWPDIYSNEILDNDKKTRLPTIVVPDIKLQVPKDDPPMILPGPTWPYPETAIPSTIIQLPYKSSATCSLKIESLERIADGVSIMKLAFHIDGAVDRSLKAVRIKCSSTQNIGNPPKVINHTPKGFDDLVSDSHLKPKGSRANIQVQPGPGPTDVHWTISRPRYRGLVSPFPTDFTLSLKLEYGKSASLDIFMGLDYNLGQFWDSRFTHSIGMNAQLFIAAGQPHSQS